MPWRQQADITTCTHKTTSSLAHNRCSGNASQVNPRDGTTPSSLLEKWNKLRLPHLGKEIEDLTSWKSPPTTTTFTEDTRTQGFLPPSPAGGRGWRTTSSEASFLRLGRRVPAHNCAPNKGERKHSRVGSGLLKRLKGSVPTWSCWCQDLSIKMESFKPQLLGRQWDLPGQGATEQAIPGGYWRPEATVPFASAWNKPQFQTLILHCLKHNREQAIWTLGLHSPRLLAQFIVCATQEKKGAKENHSIPMCTCPLAHLQHGPGAEEASSHFPDEAMEAGKGLNLTPACVMPSLTSFFYSLLPWCLEIMHPVEATTSDYHLTIRRDHIFTLFCLPCPIHQVPSWWATPDVHLDRADETQPTLLWAKRTKPEAAE